MDANVSSVRPSLYCAKAFQYSAASARSLFAPMTRSKVVIARSYCRACRAFSPLV